MQQFYLFSGWSWSIYNDQMRKGIIFIILYSISSVLIFFGVGLITPPALWIWGWSMQHDAKEINRKIAVSQVNKVPPP
jgi:hypothetical protein